MLSGTNEGMLVTYNFTLDIKTNFADQRFDIRLLIEGNKAEAFTSARVAVNHNSSIYDSSELTEELSHRFISD